VLAGEEDPRQGAALSTGAAHGADQVVQVNHWNTKKNEMDSEITKKIRIFLFLKIKLIKKLIKNE
jgi:hypothetical protein